MRPSVRSRSRPPNSSSSRFDWTVCLLSKRAFGPGASSFRRFLQLQHSLDDLFRHGISRAFIRLPQGSRKAEELCVIFVVNGSLRFARVIFPSVPPPSPTRALFGRKFDAIVEFFLVLHKLQALIHSAFVKLFE